MQRLIYVSDADCPAGGLEDFDILNEAIAFNTRAGIHGYLLRTPDQFFQVIEGPKARIDELVEMIAKDPRHHDMRILRSNATKLMRFGSWSMGFKLLRELTDPIFSPRANYSRSDVDGLLQALQNLAYLETEITRARPKHLN